MKTQTIEKGKYQANVDLPTVLYTYNFSGGIKDRTVKAGETITLISTSIEIDTPCVSFLEILHRMTTASFHKFFTKVN